MKPKTVILMVVAVACGLAASYMTSRALAPRAAADTGDAEMVNVLVAKQKIPMGTLLKDPKQYFVERPYAKAAEPKNAIKSWEQLQGKRLNRPLSEDAFVTAEALMDPKQAGLEAALPAGMRGVTLKVNAASIVAGFVQANSRVDVVQTVRQGDGSITRTILQNMLVLATDASDQRDPERKAALASTVTLAAKPEDGEKLRLAEAIGELSLSLRNLEDQEIIALKGTRPQDLFRSANADGGPNGEEGNGDGGTAVTRVPDAPGGSAAPMPEEKKEEPPPAPPKTITQIIFNGTSVTKTIFAEKEGEVITRPEKTGLEGEPRTDKKEAAAKAAKGQPEPGAKKDGEPAEKPDATK